MPAFIAQATEGFDAYAEHVRGNVVGRRSSTAPASSERTIEQIADLYCRAKNVVFGWTMGITHHEHGVANVQTIVNLALLRGMVGRPHAGLLPIRGHQQRAGHRLDGRRAEAEASGVRQPRNAPWRQAADARRAWTRWRCMQAADRGEIRSAFCLGGNLFGSNPDAKFAARALGKLELIDLPQHDAEHRPRLGPGPRDADPAGAGPRRGAAADDAGIDVQLRPPERRRPGRAWSGPRSEVDIVGDARPAAARRRWPGRLAGAAAALQRSADDRPDHSRLRAARRHRSDASRSSTSPAAFSTRRAFRRRRARPSSRAHAAAAAARRRRRSCG